MAYISGQWNIHCPVCGFKKKSGDMMLRWDGVYVCKEDYEPRHPLDLFRYVGEKEQPVPFSNEEIVDWDIDVEELEEDNLYEYDGDLQQL